MALWNWLILGIWTPFRWRYRLHNNRTMEQHHNNNNQYQQKQQQKQQPLKQHSKMFIRHFQAPLVFLVCPVYQVATIKELVLWRQRLQWWPLLPQQHKVIYLLFEEKNYSLLSCFGRFVRLASHCAVCGYCSCFRFYCWSVVLSTSKSETRQGQRDDWIGQSAARGNKPKPIFSIRKYWKSITRRM